MWYLRPGQPDGRPGAVAVSFTVNADDTVETVSRAACRSEGLITNAGVFRWYVEHNGGLELTPGYYELRPSDHMGNIMRVLRTPPAQTYTKVTFPEGFTLAKMAERLSAKVPRTDADRRS